MDTKRTEKEWLEDFQDFLHSGSLPAPSNISQNILKRIKILLHPSAYVVFLKLFGIHAIVGTLSLAICDQFGLNPFNSGLSLSQFFMTFGHSVCMTLCGMVFISFSFIAARIFLTQEEFLVLRKNYFIQSFALSTTSLGILVAFGAETTLNIALLWILGAIIGGLFPVWILSHLRIRYV